MSAKIHCDGCDKILEQGSWDHPIHGERVNKKAGGRLPDGDFDWCLACAQIAFAAVRAANQPTS